MSSQDTNIILKDLSSICRGCLDSSREMKDMFDSGLDEEFYKLTNIKINRTDDLSKLLCTECEDVITKCKNFQKQCKQSDFILNVVVKKQSTEANEIKLFDAKTSQNTITYIIRDNKLIIKITAPDTETKITYQCPQKCPERYKKKNDLLQHMINRHNFDKNFGIEIQFFCSFQNCHYHVNSASNKHFCGRKYLNQHICKVHKEKITCRNCFLNFPNATDYERHLKKCNLVYSCQICDKDFKTNERLLVHLLRKHPALHKKYKMERKSGKRTQEFDSEKVPEKVLDFSDSPKRSFATQTSELKHIKNDVNLNSCQEKSDETKTDEISTQTFDLLSLKSQTSEDESIFYSETVSLSDIQTQTLPLEFGLSRSNKETITSETQSPDLSIKETQTCFCLYDSLKNSKCVDLTSGSFCTTETQTLTLESDLLSFSSAETQTCFDDSNKGF